MAKGTGLGATVSVDNSSDALKDISNDITSFDHAESRGVQDVTGVDKSAMERLLLLADVSGTMNGIKNVAADKSHDVFKTIGTTSVERTMTLAYADGTTLTMEVLLTAYNISRGADGSQTWSVPWVLANGTAAAWT